MIIKMVTSKEHNQKKVTIVVPVYADWSTLKDCLESLKLYISHEHTIMLVNDMGPEWKKLEYNIFDCIKGCNNFIYYRNKYNLGFVKTCNKAVFEYDKTENDIMLLNSDTKVTENFLNEMLDVLYKNDNYGVVCPRSNNATFLSVPYKSNTSCGFHPELCYEIYKCIKDKLPQLTVIPTGVGFAFLLKRKLIHKYGLFDEIYGLGYNEENDFCMRIRQHGYLTVSANQAYVFHYEGKSFGDRKQRLELLNSSLLLKRYPDYWEQNKDYIYNNIDPVDYFADLLVDFSYDKKRIIFILSDNRILNKKNEKDYISLINKLNGIYNITLFLKGKNINKINKTVECNKIIKNKKLDETFHLAVIVGNAENLGIDIRRLSIKKIVLNGHEPIEDVGLEIERTIAAPINLENLREEWYSIKVRKKKIGERSLKKYLYMNHIWLFIIWNKCKKAIRKAEGKNE